MRTARKSVLLVLVVVLMLLVVAGAALAKAPTKVMIVVMDQMQPGVRQAVRHDERAVAAEPRRQLPQRLRRATWRPRRWSATT